MSEKSWDDSITLLPGIGPKSAERFGELGIETIRNLMYHFPFRYEDIQERDIKTILDQEKVTLKGTVVTPPVVNYFGGRKSRLVFQLAVGDSDVIQVVFFNQPYLAKQIEVGDTQGVYGKWQSDRQNLLGMKLLKAQDEGAAFDPVYHATKGLKQSMIVKAIRQAFADYSTCIQDRLPAFLNEKYRLMPLKDALYQMHFPEDDAAHHQAERKIIFDEFFFYQWRLQQASFQQRQHTGIEVHYDVDDLKQLIQALPYELTNAQKQAVNEICYDLLAPYPMQRMLQGDVGSGKTLVAFLALYATLTAGYQGAMMVPTEILAKQHAQAFNETFASLGLQCELLVSHMPSKEKERVLANLASGESSVVIGTHALIQDQVQFANLGLVVIDEQHRFGVRQRHKLLSAHQKDKAINLLQMTATPIPRSLALSIYGEMSVSTIDELPKGRQPIQTKLAKASQINVVYQHMEEELAKGHQIYYVLPLIDQSENLADIDNVNEVYERLAQRFPQYNIGVLHGQLDKESQTEAMECFVTGQMQLLVATTMVEVGVNVPNATMIVIQSAERFGLAQLHQLRGRVGRSDLPSYCYLIGDPTTDQGKARLKIMAESQDGFYISQEDMKIRGSGEIFGQAQSGIPEFHYANLLEDQVILKVARKEVQQLLRHPEQMTEAELETLMAWSQGQMIEI